jgi:hypothetical protein
MTTRQNLAVVVGTYQADGKEKNRYMNVGSIITKDDGGKFLELNPFINYTALPRKEGKLYLSVFDEENKQQTTSTPAVKPSTSYDEVPF